MGKTKRRGRRRTNSRSLSLHHLSALAKQLHQDCILHTYPAAAPYSDGPVWCRLVVFPGQITQCVGKRSRRVRQSVGSRCSRTLHARLRGDLHSNRRLAPIPALPRVPTARARSAREESLSHFPFLRNCWGHQMRRYIRGMVRANLEWGISALRVPRRVRGVSRTPSVPLRAPREPPKIWPRPYRPSIHGSFTRVEMAHPVSSSEER